MTSLSGFGANMDHSGYYVPTFCSVIPHYEAVLKKYEHAPMSTMKMPTDRFMINLVQSCLFDYPVNRGEDEERRARQLAGFAGVTECGVWGYFQAGFWAEWDTVVSSW